jgi:hypothetical protein
LTFGTLLSSQGTEAAFGPPFPACPPGFPFVVSPTLADAFRSELPPRVSETQKPTLRFLSALVDDVFDERSSGRSL